MNARLWPLALSFALAGGAFADPPSSGTASVLVMRLTFGGVSYPLTQAQLESRHANADDAIQRFSYGAAEIAVTVMPDPPLILPTSQADYSMMSFQGARDQIANEANPLAIAAGFDPANFDIVTYTFPRTFTGADDPSGIGSGTTCRIWINSNVMAAPLLTHELLHVYGMGHASSWTANSNSIFGRDGTWDEYGDPADVMGGNQGGIPFLPGNVFPNNHPNPVLARNAGWVPPGKIVDVSAGGKFALYRFDHPDALDAPGPIALRLTATGGEPYTLAYRFGAAPDGAILLWDYQGFRSRLLDATPGSGLGILDAPLPVGSTFTDPTGQVRVTIADRSGTGTHRFLTVVVETEPDSSPGLEMSLPAFAPAFAMTPFTLNDYGGWTWHTDFDLNTAPFWTAASATFGEMRVVGERGLATGGNEVVIGRTETRHPFARFEKVAANAGAPINTIHSGGQTLIVGLDGQVAFTQRPFGWSVRNVPLDVHRIAGEGTTAVPFVAVGEAPGGGGAAIRSTNGGNSWSATSFPGGIPILRGVARSDLFFVAVGDDGAGFVSPDGLGWTAVPTGTAGDLHAVAHGVDTWVAVGDNNCILTSPDVFNWTRRATLVGRHLHAVAFANGRFFASGNGTGIGISYDAGQTWELGYAPDRTNGILVLDALAVDERAVFSAGSGVAVCAHTRTGRRWAPIPDWDANDIATAATFHGGRLFVTTDGGDVLASDPLHGADVSFSNWSLSHVAAPGSPLLAGDPDSDGKSNLVEYTRATHPAIGTFGSPDHGIWQTSTGSEFFFHFPARPDTRITTTFETSNDLLNWFPVTPAPLTSGDALLSPVAPAGGGASFRWTSSL